MALAVVATAYGGPEVLAPVEVEVGQPGPGEIKVQARAAGVNPSDVKGVAGAWGKDPSRLPLRLGFEVSGVVTAVGDGVTELASGPLGVGDQVIVHPVSGAYATELLAPAANAVHKPGDLPWEQAGGLLLTGVTAAHALAVAGTEPGSSVLVHGASGGVGLMVVQLAVAAGARVVGTASPAQHDLLRSLGTLPIAYGPGLQARAEALVPEGFDSAIDTVGTQEALDASVSLVRDRSRIVTTVAAGPAGDLGIKAIGSGPGADPGREVRAAARPRLASMAGEGRLKVFVRAMFPLVQAADAHRLLSAGHGGGKIILLP